MKVEAVEAKKEGSRSFDLAFYHANYSEGVRNKTYELRTIERAESFIFAKRCDDSGLFILLFPMTAAWLNNHFNAGLLDDESLCDWLARNC